MCNALEKDRVIDTVSRLFINTDNRDWPRVKALFAPRVLFDMTSSPGPARVPQAAGDRRLLGQGAQSTQCNTPPGGQLPCGYKDNEATAFCYGVTWHYLPNKAERNTRTFVGSYDLHLVKQDEDWKIDRFKFNLKFIDGNADLEKS